MVKEVEKFEIEDIKDPDDLDIDEAINEEEPGEVPVSEKSVKSEAKAAVSEPEKDVLERVVEEAPEEKLPSSLKAKHAGKLSWLKYLAIIFGVALFIVGLAYGAMYYLNKKEKDPEAPAVTNTEEKTQEPEPEADVATKFLYINSEVGLNLREEPNTKAKSSAIIPFGYKITVIEEQSDWVKTTYQEKTGWVSLGFLSETDPLVYENKTYGFGFTFKPPWSGYKFVEAKTQESDAVAIYYVTLPTTDKKWKEPNIPTGYASLFVMGVYTKTEWAKLEGEEMKPGKLGESNKYVYTYMPAQAYASDLELQYNEIKEIIEAFEVLK